MKKIAFFRDKRFENNNFYNVDIDRNLSPFLELVKINGEENTLSIDKINIRKDKNDFIIVCRKTLSIFSLLDYVRLFIQYRKNIKYYIILEPIVVAPLWYSKLFHLFFDKILTRKDDLIDNNKYFKFTRPQSYSWLQDSKPFHSRKLIVLMNANKWSPFPHELYSERVKFIRYCEKHTKDFDLYGWWWNKANFQQKICGFNLFPSYKWRAGNKIETIWNYKFNVCFENMKDTPWYITEKIRDSFKAKTIPIYRWASNIIEYVPAGCFIDYREYIWKEYKLFEFLEGMSEEIYNNYIRNIESFLETNKTQKRFDKERARDFIKLF